MRYKEKNLPILAILTVVMQKLTKHTFYTQHIPGHTHKHTPGPIHGYIHEQAETRTHKHTNIHSRTSIQIQKCIEKFIHKQT